jgi:hypothetical protein
LLGRSFLLPALASEGCTQRPWKAAGAGNVASPRRRPSRSLLPEGLERRTDFVGAQSPAWQAGPAGEASANRERPFIESRDDSGTIAGLPAAFLPGRRLAATPPRLPWADTLRPFRAEPMSESVPLSTRDSIDRRASLPFSTTSQVVYCRAFNPPLPATQRFCSA